MGTSCSCGGKDGKTQETWESNTGAVIGPGQGYYSGAVNQILFNGSMPNGSPFCGQACGQCYELVSTGIGGYSGGVVGGSKIVLMIVDSCFGTDVANPATPDNPNWCTSTTGGSDYFGCNTHFDIDTDPVVADANNPNAVPHPIGQDGKDWPSESNFALFLPRPSTASLSFSSFSCLLGSARTSDGDYEFDSERLLSFHHLLSFLLHSNLYHASL